MLSWSELLFTAAIFSTKSCRGQTKHKALLGRRSWNSSSFAQRIIRNQTKPAMRLIRPAKGAAIDAAWSLAMLRTVFVSMWSGRNTKDDSQYPTSSTKCIGPVDGRSKSTFRLWYAGLSFAGASGGVGHNRRRMRLEFYEVAGCDTHCRPSPLCF